MRNKSLAFRTIASVLVIVLLIAVRANERVWFPEALIDFFASTRYLTEALPPLGSTDYFNIAFRFGVNSVLSVILLYLWFDDRSLTRFVIKVYLYFGILFFLLFLISVWIYHPGDYRFLFYLRRLLIHPVLLFVLIPGIYFVKKSGMKTGK